MIMRYTQTLGQNGTAVRPLPETSVPAGGAPAAPTVKEIPYDHVARFELRGERGNRVQEVLNISTDGAFVAVAIGYSFIPAALPPQPVQSPPGGVIAVAPLSLLGGSLILESLDAGLLARLAGIDFKYSIVDSGTGRELQNRSIHNIAGLGEPNGKRPFRPLAKPHLFMPRSTIRIEIEEVSQGITEAEQAAAGGQQLYSIYGYTRVGTQVRVGCELYIVFQGYKMLGYGTEMA
jgi:hypothetical protein